MPLIDAPPDALADTYARSLFELADQAGGRDTVESVLGELEDILELARSEPRFGEFLSSRTLPTAARAASLSRIFAGRIQDLTLRFLLLLNARGRLGYLIPIVAAFDALVQQRFGRVEVDVFTAEPVEPEQLRFLHRRLEQILGREPILHPYVDPTMLGGVRLRIGDRLIDASLATQLRRLRDRLASEGPAQVRLRASRIIDEDSPPDA